ncbi:hypothetical protein CFE70_009613 [Pyrenophora teres f. teres 0-1]
MAEPVFQYDDGDDDDDDDDAKMINCRSPPSITPQITTSRPPPKCCARGNTPHCLVSESHTAPVFRQYPPHYTNPNHRIACECVASVTRPSGFGFGNCNHYNLAHTDITAASYPTLKASYRCTRENQDIQSDGEIG